MNSNLEKRAYKVSEFCMAFGIGKTLLYEEVRKGRLKVFKVKTVTLISAEAAKNWLELCQKESCGEMKLSAGKVGA